MQPLIDINKPIPVIYIIPIKGSKSIMKIYQQAIQLKERKRGFHIITAEVIYAIPQINEIKTGICQVFIQHTSASLSINENADPTVRKDFEMYFNKAVPENDPDYLHDDEGPDDMPAHLKAAMLGCSVMIPISNGRLALGTWQGIYLCEHRNYGGHRNLLITAWGE
jgi:secondary thiamine-phosphate synthase enzyme